MYIVDRKGPIPAWIPLYVTNLLKKKSDVILIIWTHVKSFIYIYISHFMLNDSHFNPKEERTRLCNNKEVVVALTHQWGSWLAVTTIISSLKKASCSELTALQSTKALTRFWCGLLPETCRRHVIYFSACHQQIYIDCEIAQAFSDSPQKKKSPVEWKHVVWRT